MNCSLYLDNNFADRIAQIPTVISGEVSLTVVVGVLSDFASPSLDLTIIAGAEKLGRVEDAITPPGYVVDASETTEAEIAVTPTARVIQSTLVETPGSHVDNASLFTTLSTPSVTGLQSTPTVEMLQGRRLRSRFSWLALLPCL